MINAPIFICAKSISLRGSKLTVILHLILGKKEKIAEYDRKVNTWIDRDPCLEYKRYGRLVIFRPKRVVNDKHK